MSSLIAPQGCSGEEENRRRVLLDCTPDELESVLSSLLGDLTAGSAAVARLACSCQTLRQLVRSAQPQLDRCAAALGWTGSSLSLAQLNVLETVHANCAYESEWRHGAVATVYFTKGGATLRPGSSLNRLDEFAALLRRHPRCTCSVDAHALGSRVQRREVACARAIYVLRGLIERGVAPEALEGMSWEDGIILSGAPGWAMGSYEARRVELFFSLDGVQLPRRPHYYEQRDKCEFEPEPISTEVCEKYE